VAAAQAGRVDSGAVERAQEKALLYNLLFLVAIFSALPLARLVLEAGVFSERFPEEKDPGLVHVIRTEVMVREGTRELTRVYYKSIPTSLSPLQDAVGKLIERVKAQGEHGVYHEGRRIDVGDAAPPPDAK